MISVKISQILKGLLQKSEAGHVKWVDSRSVGMEAVMDQDYIVALPDSSINIFSVEDKIRVNFLNSEGDVVASVESTEDLETAALLQRLLQSARNSALDVDGTLESLMRAITSEEEMGGATPKLKIPDF